MYRSYILKIVKIVFIYIVLSIAFYFIARRGFRFQPVSTKLQQPEAILDELSVGTYVEQEFISSIDIIEKVSLYMNTFSRENEGILTFSIFDEQYNVLTQLKMDTALLENDGIYEWNFEKPLDNTLGRKLRLTIESECPIGKAPSIYGYYGTMDGFTMMANERNFNIALCISYAGLNSTWFESHYTYCAIGILVILILYLNWTHFCLHHNRDSRLSITIKIWKRYKFLIQQLVSRDFKTKYKRSILGYLWSFLNPLFTTAIQYIVFSTIFKSDIKNFPVYLLSGIVLFGFFTDSVGQGLSAIVSNAPLITKVYVPKYIYPITKVISSSINLGISLIPLLIICILTKAPLSAALLLLPFVIVCLITFCIGMSLLLSSAMVFFRDTQYLWGIISLAWMYATPLFYPENIIPSEFIFIQKANPLYYMIKFARIVLIEGISPQPHIYACCFISAIATMLLGSVVFKKTQNRFVLYI